jgi:hypothetical protein
MKRLFFAAALSALAFAPSAVLADTTKAPKAPTQMRGFVAPTKGQLRAAVRSGYATATPIARSAAPTSMKGFKQVIIQKQMGPDSGTWGYYNKRTGQVFYMQETIAGPMWKQGTLPRF